MTWQNAWRTLVLTPLLIWGFISPARAQDSTPTADSERNLRIVRPSECQVSPRSTDDLTALLALDGDGVPPPARVMIRPPLGEVVDPVTAISIKEAARDVLACFNAQDLARAAALMTDHGVQQVFWSLSGDASARCHQGSPRDATTSTGRRRIDPVADRYGYLSLDRWPDCGVRHRE